MAMAIHAFPDKELSARARAKRGQTGSPARTISSLRRKLQVSHVAGLNPGDLLPGIPSSW
jgi:hypothetical protein